MIEQALFREVFSVGFRIHLRDVRNSSITNKFSILITEIFEIFGFGIGFGGFSANSKFLIMVSNAFGSDSKILITVSNSI